MTFFYIPKQYSLKFFSANRVIYLDFLKDSIDVIFN